MCYWVFVKEVWSVLLGNCQTSLECATGICLGSRECVTWCVGQVWNVLLVVCLGSLECATGYLSNKSGVCDLVCVG